MANLSDCTTSMKYNCSAAIARESCFFLPDPKFDKVLSQLVTNLVTGVLNAVLSPCGIVANSLVILVIIRKVSLRSPLNLLLGCLAVSDLLVGLFVQPSYVAFRLVENQDTFVPCSLRLFYSNGFFVCYGVSLVTLCAISCERYIALFCPLRYYHVIRYSRVLKLVISIWIMNILLTGLQWVHNKVARGIHLASWLVLLLTAVVGQLRILPLIHRHQKQIKRLECHQKIGAGQMQIKFTANIACRVAVYLAFNLPVLLITAVHQIMHINIDTYNFYSWAETVTFFNSSLNALICIWRVKAIREAIVKLWPSTDREEAYLTSLELRSNDIVLVSFRSVASTEDLVEN